MQNVGGRNSPPMQVNLPPPVMQVPTYPLGMIAATLDSFSGKNAVQYFEKLERRSNLDGWTEGQTLQLAKFKLEGEAYNFFKSDPTLDALTYADLKNKFITKFLPIKLPGEAQLNFSRCYQRQDESVSSYCTRLRSLGTQLLKEDLEGATRDEVPGLKKKNKEVLISQFKLGLRKDLLREVGVLLLREPDLDLEKAEQLVKLQETTQVMIYGKEKASKVFQIDQEKKCYQCGRTGHLANECRRKIETDERPNNQRNSCYKCGKVGHVARECKSGNGREQSQNAGCYNCGKAGHYARDCRSKKEETQVLCYGCNKHGHFARVCPERNNQRMARGKWEENKRQNSQREYQNRTLNSSNFGNGLETINNTGAIPKQPGNNGRTSQGSRENNNSLN